MTLREHLRLLGLFLAIAAHAAGWSATMSLTTDKRVYRPGDSVALSATITPSSSEEGTPVDLYVIATLGNGAVFSLDSSLSWAAGRSAMFAGFPLVAVNAPRFN